MPSPRFPHKRERPIRRRRTSLSSVTGWSRAGGTVHACLPRPSPAPAPIGRTPPRRRRPGAGHARAAGRASRRCLPGRAQCRVALTCRVLPEPARHRAWPNWSTCRSCAPPCVVLRILMRGRRRAGRCIQTWMHLSRARAQRPRCVQSWTDRRRRLPPMGEVSDAQ